MADYKEQLPFLLNEQNWRCNGCGCRLVETFRDILKPSASVALDLALGLGFPSVANVDHIWPVSKAREYTGNIDEYENLQALCADCNSTKADKTLTEWLSEMGDDSMRMALSRLYSHFNRRNRYLECNHSEQKIVLHQRHFFMSSKIVEWKY